MGSRRDGQSPADPAAGCADGKLVHYTADDFDEMFTTTDEHEAARHVKLGWILLDEVVGREGGKPAIDTFWRQAAACFLPRTSRSTRRPIT